MNYFSVSNTSLSQQLSQWLVVSITGLLLIYTPLAGAATDMFLMIEDVPGESKDPIFPGAIEITGFSWGISAGESGGGGGGAAVPEIQELSMIKQLDSASASFFSSAFTGETYREALLIVRKTSDVPFEYFALQLENVRVTSVSSAVSKDDNRVMENVTLNFTNITTHYRPQKEDGTAGPLSSDCYNLAANVKC